MEQWSCTHPTYFIMVAVYAPASNNHEAINDCHVYLFVSYIIVMSSNGNIDALMVICAGVHRLQMNSPDKGQRCGALMMFPLIAWINGWINNRDAGDLKCHRAHYDVTVMNRRAINDRQVYLIVCLCDIYHITVYLYIYIDIYINITNH